MNCLVTGGAGFIGSHVADALIAAGHTVIVYDNLATGTKQNIPLKTRFVNGDICDLPTLKKAMQGVEYVFHHAAAISVPESFDKPAFYFDVNVNGTSNVLEAARLCGVTRVIFASSSAVYGDSAALPLKEDKLGTRLSPYAITKYTGEDMCRLYWKIHGLETVHLRYFNAFGERQNPNSAYAAVIPKFISTLLSQKQPVIFGDGTQTRDFTYVGNIARANILAMNSKRAAGESINIGNGKAITLNMLYATITKILHTPTKPQYAPARKGDILHSHANITKAKTLLGDINPYTLAQGLTRTINWFKEQI